MSASSLEGCALVCGARMWVFGEPPKDGKCYLGFFPEQSGYVADQRFVPIHWSGWGGGTWDNQSGQHISGKPTHWMRLPEPPN